MKKEQMTKIQNVCWVPFILHSRWHCFHSTTKRKTNLTFSVFTRDNNRTTIQISNLIFLLTQTLYLLPEFSSVFKCLLGEILINKCVGTFQLSAIFQDIFFVSKIQQATDDCPWLIFLVFFGLFCSVGSFYDNFVFNVQLLSERFFLLQLRNTLNFLRLFP